ncbi:hypothetical protein DRP04_04835, partial [Archaeoglobales archaeon]
QVAVPIPESMLPLTYNVKLTVEANGLKASGETTLKVVPETPGFGVIAVTLAGVAALALRKRF